MIFVLTVTSTTAQADPRAMRRTGMALTIVGIVLHAAAFSVAGVAAHAASQAQNGEDRQMVSFLGWTAGLVFGAPAVVTTAVGIPLWVTGKRREQRGAAFVGPTAVAIQF